MVVHTNSCTHWGYCIPKTITCDYHEVFGSIHLHCSNIWIWGDIGFVIAVAWKYKIEYIIDFPPAINYAKLIRNNQYVLNRDWNAFECPYWNYEALRKILMLGFVWEANYRAKTCVHYHRIVSWFLHMPIDRQLTLHKIISSRICPNGPHYFIIKTLNWLNKKDFVVLCDSWKFHK